MIDEINIKSDIHGKSKFYLPFMKLKLNLFINLSTNSGVEASETIIQNKHDMWFVSAHSSDKELSDIDSSEVCL